VVFFRNFKGIFEIQNQSAIGNAKVRTSIKKHRQLEKRLEANPAVARKSRHPAKKFSSHLKIFSQI
jgi:hypothetical protein